MEVPRLLVGKVIVLFLVVVVSLECESRKYELRSVTEGEMKTGNWTKSRFD